MRLVPRRFLQPGALSAKFGGTRSLLLALPILFHFQLIARIPGTAVHLALADLILPILLLWFFSVSVHQRRAPDIDLSSPVVLLLFLITAWLFAELWVGRFYSGTWQTWAWVNKFGGWLALLGYFFVGMMVGHEQRLRDRLVQVFLATAWLVALNSLVLFLLYFWDALVEHSYYAISGYRMPGFANNPNAYGYMLAFAAAVQLPYLRVRRLFPLRLHVVGLALLLACLFLTGSRSAHLGFILMFVAFLLLRLIDIRRLAIALLLIAHGALFLFYLPYKAPSIATAIVQALPSITQAGQTQAGQIERPGPNLLYATRANIFDDSGTRSRWAMAKEAWRLWRQHPVIGIGLGSFYWQQKKLHPKDAYVLHNSLLWILTEMGLIGLLLFLGLFIVTIRLLLMPLQLARMDPLRMAAVGALLVCVGASAGLEAIYQRHLWFLLGLALATRIYISKNQSLPDQR